MAYSTAAAPRVGTTFPVQSDYNGGLITPAQYMNRPEVRKKIFDAYRENMLFDTLFHSGRTKVSDHTTFRWKEFDSYWHMHTAANKTGTAGAGNAATFTLSTADHLNTGKLSQIKQKDEVFVYTATGVVKGYVTATNKVTDDAHTATVIPIDSTLDLVTLSATGNKIAIFSNGASDGANMTPGTTRLPVDFYNYLQIIETQKRLDEGEAANKTFVEVNGKPYYSLQAAIDGDFEQRYKVDATALFGIRGTATDPVTAGTTYFNGGLEWSADNDGYRLAAYGSAFIKANLQEACRNLSLERAPLKQLIICGNELDMQIDDLVKGQLDNTAVDWAQMGMGSVKDRMVDFGIDGFRYNGFSFVKQKLDAFNYIGATGGITTSPYPYMGFILSWDKYKDAKGEDMDTVCLRFKEGERGSRLTKFWTRDHKITNDDKFEMNWKGECGIQIALPRHINKIVK